MSADSYYHDLDNYAELIVDDIIDETPTHFWAQLLAEDAVLLERGRVCFEKSKADYIVADSKLSDGPTRVRTSYDYAEEVGVTDVMYDLRTVRGF